MWHIKLKTPWCPLQLIWYQMITGVLYVIRQATLVGTAQMQRVITVKTLATLPSTVQTNPPSGTVHYHNRLCSQPHYEHNHRDRFQSLNYSQGRCFVQSRSHCQSLRDRGFRNYWRNASCSPSHHCHTLSYTSTDWCSRKYSHWDINAPAQPWLIQDMPLFVLESLLRQFHRLKPIWFKTLSPYSPQTIHMKGNKTHPWTAITHKSHCQKVVSIEDSQSDSPQNQIMALIL